MKKVLKIIRKILVWTLGIFLSLALIGTILVYLFQDKIIQYAISEINKNLNAKIEVPEVDLTLWAKFPDASLRFRNVKIYEGIKDSPNLLGSAKTIYITFNIWELFSGNYNFNEVYIEEGQFHLKVDAKGQRNFIIVKPDSSSSGSASAFNLEKVKCTNVLIQYSDESARQHYSVQASELTAHLNSKNDLYNIRLEGPMVVNTISLSGKQYFREKSINLSTEMTYSDRDKLFTLLPSTLKLARSAYKVSGTYGFKNKNLMDFSVQSEEGDMHTLLSLLPKENQDWFEAYQSDGKVFFNARIHGEISPTSSPSIRADFGLENVSFYHPDRDMKLEKIQLKGHFTNGELRNAQSSELRLQNIQCVLDQHEIKGEVWYRDFNAKHLKISLKGAMEADALFQFISIQNLKRAAGLIRFDVNFEGDLERLQTYEGKKSVQTSGILTLSDLKAEYGPYMLDRGSAEFSFDRNDIVVNRMEFKLGASDFNIKGGVQNLIARAFFPEEPLLFNLDLNSRLLRTSDLFKSSEGGPGDASSCTWPCMEKYKFLLKYTIDHLYHQKYHLSHFAGQVRFDQPVLELTNTQFGFAGGEIKLSGSSKIHSDKEIQNSATLSLKDFHIDSLMYTMDNFGQTFITDQNLHGNYNGIAQLSFTCDKNFNINMSSLIGELEGTIVRGELVNLEAMQNLSRFIKSDVLQDIRFSELNTKIYIKDQVISFPEIKITSTAFDLAISGTHTFGNDMDYKLAIPLKELKYFSKMDKDAAYGAIEDNGQGQSTVFLTIKGNLDNYKIAYDSKRTKKKIQEDLKKEGQEFKQLFKKKEETIQQAKPNTQEFFDFD